MQPNYYLDVSKVADVLRNFSDYRKKPGKRGGGKTWPGLKYFEQADIYRTAIRLLSTSWGGRDVTNILKNLNVKETTMRWGPEDGQLLYGFKWNDLLNAQPVMLHCLMMMLSMFRGKIVMSNHVIDYTGKRLT